MDGIPALDLWDFVIDLLHSSSIQPRARGNLLCDEHCEKTFQRKNEERVQHVGRSWLIKYRLRHTKRKISRFDPSLYIFDDNEAVIKIIIKGSSPTMRHISRTHRVAVD